MRLAAVARPRAVTEELEAAARLDAEAAFLANARALAAEAGRLQARADRLAAVAGLEQVPGDAHVRCLVWTTLDESHNPASSVKRFNAFTRARTMPEVIAARSGALRSVGPLQVSDGKQVKWLSGWSHENYSFLSAALSACGVLCIGGETNALVVAHLPRRRSATIVCGSRINHGFVHDGELFVAQGGRDILWHAPVAEVLAGRTDLADFEQMPLVAEWGFSARLDAAPAGWVAVGSLVTPSQHLVVDLAARTSRIVELEQNLPILGGFAGIHTPGANWVATSSSPSDVFAVAPDGTTKMIARNLYPFPTVLPSAAEPTDLSRAAVFDSLAAFSVGDARGQMVDPFRPHFQSLVRVYRDVFLAWDNYRNGWFTARIVVP